MGRNQPICHWCCCLDRSYYLCVNALTPLGLVVLACSVVLYWSSFLDSPGHYLKSFKCAGNFSQSHSLTHSTLLFDYNGDTHAHTLELSALSDDKLDVFPLNDSVKRFGGVFCRPSLPLAPLRTSKHTFHLLEGLYSVYRMITHHAANRTERAPTRPRALHRVISLADNTPGRSLLCLKIYIYMNKLREDPHQETFSPCSVQGKGTKDTGRLWNLRKSFYPQAV